MNTDNTCEVMRAILLTNLGRTMLLNCVSLNCCMS